MRHLLCAMFTVVLTVGSPTLVGCTTVGRVYDDAKVDNLKPGISTTADAQAELGPPTSVTTGASGSTLLQWQFSRGNSFGGGSGGHVAILFDAAGTMVRVTHRFKLD